MFIKRIFLIGFLVSSIVNAENPKVATAETSNSKIDPAIKELFAQLGVEEKIQNSIIEADKFFSVKAEMKPELVTKLKAEKSKNNDKKALPNAEALARVAKFNSFKEKAKVQYDKMRGGLKDEVELAIANEFKKNFSDAEVKYLLSVAKFPIFKKLSLFLSSDKMQDPLNIPGQKASECLKAIMSEKAPEQNKKN
jgi:hypothetical protein